MRLNSTQQKLAWLLLASTLLHMGLGWSLGLSGDEAHYALYATHPALSYYDHPPMVGWVQWPLVWLNAPDGLLRLIPQALWVITALLVFATTQRLQAIFQPAASQDGRPAQSAGLWAVGVFSLAPLLHILGVGLLPDTLLMTLSAALALQTLRMLDAREMRRISAWLILGILLGLAGLSKYTAIFAALAVVICFFAVHGVRWLLLAGPWLALTLALFVVAPVFVWNAQHNWISFAYQLKHGAGNQWQLSQLGVFLLAQTLVYGPLALLGLLRTKSFLFTSGRLSGIQKAAWLLVFFGIPFGVLAYLSGGGTSLPHWTASAWVCLAPFAGLGLAHSWRQGQRLLIATLAGLQACICLGLFALMFFAGAPWQSAESTGPDQREKQNPFTDFHGWDAAGATAQRLAQAHGLPNLAVQNWTLASRLAWYARPLSVFVLDPGFDQFSIWSGDLPRGSKAILMDWSQMSYRLPVGAQQFAQCTFLQEQSVERLQRKVASFRFFLCSDWGGVPAPVRGFPQETEPAPQIKPAQGHKTLAN